MSVFWENKYREVKTMWGMEPSDSALLAKDFFQSQQVRDILVPGVGYGRNAKIFLENGIRVTGIEISEYAINMAYNEYNLDFPIHHGSVINMPFDNKLFDGIFCYALLHLLNKQERSRFLKNCYNQLQPNGYMIFTVVSKRSSMFGNGRKLSRDRYEVIKGLKVFFYDPDSIRQEFKHYGLTDFMEMDEPIKHMENEPPLKCILVKCKKKEPDNFRLF